MEDHQGERMRRITFDEIEKTTSRLPYNPSELSVAFSAVNERRRQKHDLVVGDMGLADLASEPDDLQAAALEGFMIFCSPNQLRTLFVFAKCDAGRGFFGGQKSVYASYIKGMEDEDWQVGPMFKSWLLAVTSMGNLYRAVGL
jgi:hypothetical protein